jgi:methanol metabolism-related c-type cytochrome
MRRPARTIPILMLAGIATGLGTTGHAATETSSAPQSSAELRSDGPTQPASVQDGQYKDKNGDPTYHVTDAGKKVDWYTMSGYLRYSANCIVCHGPDGMGSTYAPSLVDALKGMDYAHFAGIVVGGKKDVNAAQELVMPAFGENRNVMCYMPDIYTYLRARADGALGRNRPAEHEPKPAAFEKAEDACMK